MCHKSSLKNTASDYTWRSIINHLLYVSLQLGYIISPLILVILIKLITGMDSSTTQLSILILPIPYFF